jgi:hypothetical protein
MQEHQGRGRWTATLRMQFLDRLSGDGNVRAAAAACGLSRQSVYKLRRRDPDFAGEWDAAVMTSLERRRQAFADALRQWYEQLGIDRLDIVNSINPVSTSHG